MGQHRSTCSRNLPNARRVRWHLSKKVKEIDIEAIKAATQLSPEALRKKEARDRELAAIISGEDDRILLVMGPCSSDNEEAVLEYARRLADLQKKLRIKSLS